MKKTLLFIILIVCMSLTAFANNDPGEDLSDFLLSPVLAPLENKWGDDILIDSGLTGPFDFATDYNSGDIYTIKTTHSSPDTTYLYRSTDNGLTWDYMRIGATNGDGGLEDAEIIVTEGGKISCLIINVESSGTRTLYMREFDDSTLNAAHWETISRPEDTVQTFDVDYSDGYYYVTYTLYDTDLDWNIYGATCHEDSSTWTNQTSLFGRAYAGEEARIAAGIGGAAYVAFIEDRMTAGIRNIRVKRTFNYGASWLLSEEVSSLTGQTIANVDIACAKNSPEVVWTTVQFNSLGNWGYYLSTDSCRTSNYQTVFSLHSGWDEYMGTVEAHPTFSWATFAFRSDSGTDNHNVAFFYMMSGDPTNAIDLQEINDHDATNTYRPCAGNTMGNSAVMYAGWGPRNLYFDTYANNLGIEDNNSSGELTAYASPRITNNMTNIFFTLNESRDVSIEIFNTMGQRMWKKNAYYSSGTHSVNWKGSDYNGTPLPSGLYFFRVHDGREIVQGKITLL